MTTSNSDTTDVYGVDSHSPVGATEIPGRPPGEAEAIHRLRRHLRAELSTRLTEHFKVDDHAGPSALSHGERRRIAETILHEAADVYAQTELATGRAGILLEPQVEQRVITTVLDELCGVGGLEPLLADPEIENININGDQVFVKYADGRRARRPPVAESDAALIELIRELAARSGVEERRFDRAAPIVNFQLPGGERVSAVMAVATRPSVSIRRHRFQKVTLAQLRQNGTIDLTLESFLAALVRAKKNVLITGGTGVGKTTLLRALASAIPSWERLVTIEDVYE